MHAHREGQAHPKTMKRGKPQGLQLLLQNSSVSEH